MNLAQIREECWEEAFDVIGSGSDKFWPEDVMNRYINRIYYHIARETRCIRDASTASVCIIDGSVVDYSTYASGTLDYIWANDSTSPLYQLDVAPYLYDLHKSILDIDEVKLMRRKYQLHKVTSAVWQRNTMWEQTIGAPTQYATDLNSKKIAVSFRDGDGDTLQLAVKRLPLVELVLDTDEPEFREDFHQHFKDGVLWLMYKRQDAETFNMAKSKQAKDDFDDAIDELKQAVIKLDERIRPNAAMGAFL
jgi:hypothetical protein